MRWIFLLLPVVYASQRVVLTFATHESAVESTHAFVDTSNVSIVKQYGRRLVLHLGTKHYSAAEDDAWLQHMFPTSTRIEEDLRVGGKQINFDFFTDSTNNVESLEDLQNMEWPDQTETPNWMESQVGQESTSSSFTQVPWNLADSEPFGLRVENRWRTTNSTPDTVVAVLDTGVHLAAASAFAHLMRGYDFISDVDVAGDEDGRDPDAHDNGPTDAECPTPSWHGTKVTSVLAARHDSGVYGVAQNVSVLPVRVLGLCSSGYANDITDGIVWASGGQIDGMETNLKPAQILSMSLAGTGACPSYLQSAITYAHNAGVKIYAAAGNDGADSINNTFPANCKHVISVGATLRDGTLASYSNKKATVTAPGGDGFDPIPVLSVRNSILIKTFAVGTSVAVPHVSGLTALDQHQRQISTYKLALNVFNISNLTLYGADEFSGRYLCEKGATRIYCVCNIGEYGLTARMENYAYVDIPSYGRYFYVEDWNGQPVFRLNNNNLICRNHQWKVIPCATSAEYDSCGYYGNLGECDSHFTVGLAAIVSGYGCYPCAAGTFNDQYQSLYCQSCAQGYFSAAQASSCTPCSAGTVSALAAGSTTCNVCPAGKYSGAASLTCLSCLKGTWSQAQSGICFTCQPGYYCPNDEATSQTPCLAGTFSDWGAIQCTACPAGKISGSSLSVGCTACPEGTYQPNAGASACVRCPVGYKSTAVESTVPCAACPAGTFNLLEGQTSCALCDAGSYKDTSGPGLCIACGIGYMSSVVGATSPCAACPAGTFNTLVKQVGCTSCDPGTYKANTGPGLCVSCGADTYTPNTGQQACTSCTVCSGNTYRTRICTATVDTGCTNCDNCVDDVTYQTTACASTQNRICSACLTCALNTQYETQRCTGTNNRVCSSCTLCALGTYKSGGCTGTTNTICTACGIGTYTNSLGATTCQTCGLGTFASNTGASACATCTDVCSDNQRMQRDCAASHDRICCFGATAGFYRDTCTTQQMCPALPNGVYILNNLISLNRCPNFQCNPNYFATPSDLALAATRCSSVSTVGLLQYGLNSACASFMGSVCKPYTQCAAGTTRLRTLDGQYIIDPATNDVQCIPCSACVHGTTLYAACTPMAQTVCVKCAWTGLVNEYSYEGQCSFFIPKGYYPYQLQLSAAYLSQVTTNHIAFPRQALTETNFLIDLPWDQGIALNVLVPCMPVPHGYMFVDWITPPIAKTVQVANILTQYVEQCNADVSMACVPYDSEATQGWFKNASNLCQPCFESRSFTPCGWRQFRDLTTCTGSQSAYCKLCRGVMPEHAQWTKARAPYSFDDTEPQPCDWECNPGYFRNGSVCSACSKPLNSNFEVGPMRPAGTLPTTCLNPGDASTCKFFGGTLAAGCMWVCRVGYRNVNGVCEQCPAVSCAPGQAEFVRSDNCYDCQACNPVVDNAVYSTGCAFTCREGYFQFNATHCRPCTTVLPCNESMYSGNCGGSRDTSCVQCTSCGNGLYETEPCNSTHNTACAACTEALVPNSMYVNGCEIQCEPHFIMVGNSCVPCARSDLDCIVGQKYSANCTLDDLGCVNCTQPATFPWCWTGGAVCSWDCLRSYRKRNGVCAPDVTKNFEPFCATEFAPAPNGTIVVVTTPVPWFPPTTTPAPTSVLLMDLIKVENMTLYDCLCRSNYINTMLSILFETQVYVVACHDELNNVAVCKDFECVCVEPNTTTSLRRLLSTPSAYGNIQIVYAEPQHAQNNVSAIGSALTTALNKSVQIQDIERRVLPTQQLAWRYDLFFSHPQSEPTDNNLAVWIGIGVVAGAVLVGAGVLIGYFTTNSGGAKGAASSSLNIRLIR